MYVTWDYYKVFYYVAKYQNFTKAARVLGSNQPNVTHTMNRLEGAAGLRAVYPQQPGRNADAGGRAALRPRLLRCRPDPGSRGGAECQCHSGARQYQHQRNGDGAEHLSLRQAARLP